MARRERERRSLLPFIIIIHSFINDPYVHTYVHPLLPFSILFFSPIGSNSRGKIGGGNGFFLPSQKIFLAFCESQTTQVFG